MAAVTKKSQTKGNVMRAVRVDKLVLNISCGGSGDRLTKAARVLNQICDQEPILSKARYTLRSFGIRRNEQIAAHVTVRGAKAMEIIERGLKVKEFELKYRNFSKDGTLCFCFVRLLCASYHFSVLALVSACRSVACAQDAMVQLGILSSYVGSHEVVMVYCCCGEPT